MIKHSGIISKKNNNILTVDIEAMSACANCHAKGMCTSLDKKTKQIDVNSSDDSFKIGDKVFILMEEKLGTKAILLGYLIPFIILIVTIIILINLLESEGLAGLCSIAVLIPYYLILFIFRKKIEKTFYFSIEKSE